LAYCHLIPLPLLPLARIGLSSAARQIWRNRIRPETFARHAQRCYYHRVAPIGGLKPWEKPAFPLALEARGLAAGF